MASRGKRRPFCILYYAAEREKGKVGGGGKKEEPKAKGVEWPQRTHSKNLPPLFAPSEEAQRKDLPMLPNICLKEAKKY